MRLHFDLFLHWEKTTGTFPSFDFRFHIPNNRSLSAVEQEGEPVSHWPFSANVNQYQTTSYLCNSISATFQLSNARFLRPDFIIKSNLTTQSR